MLRRLTPLLFALLVLVTAMPAGAANPEHWLLSIDRWGNPEYQLAVLDASGPVISGRMGRRVVSGVRQGNRFDFTATDGEDTLRFTGEATPETLAGDADYPDPNHEGVRATHRFTSRRLPLRVADEGMRHFAPDDYSNQFTAHRRPVMTVWPGDVISTHTVDSGGVDHAGHTRALYGNPQTGPFFIANAEPGDVLAIHIRRLRLTRDSADSLDGFASRLSSPALDALSAGLGQRVRWRLDRERYLGRLEAPPEGLEDFTVALRPMLGGLGVAPDFGYAAPSAGDSGRFGGNMDYNGLVEGVTVYLPVFQPGALLYLGDGHALQGDGETTQWALETSLAVEFSVEVLPAQPLAAPRVESADRLTVIGQAPTLDAAVKVATAGMVQWLAQAYGLDARASALVLGTSAEFRIATLAGQNAGVALSLSKRRLPPVGAARR